MISLDVDVFLTVERDLLLSDDDDALIEVLADDDATLASFAENDLWAFGFPFFFPVFNEDG